MAQKSCPVVTPQQARPPRRCGGQGQAWQGVGCHPMRIQWQGELHAMRLACAQQLAYRLAHSLQPASAPPPHFNCLHDCQRRLDAAGGPILVAAPGQAKGADGEESLLVAAELQAGKGRAEQAAGAGAFTRSAWQEKQAER